MSDERHESWRHNDLLLRRRQALLLEPGDHVVDDATLGALLVEIAHLGYGCEPALVDRIRTQSREDLVHLYQHLPGSLRQMVGDTEAFDPMYRNFPDEVMAMDEATLYLNAWKHYFGDLAGFRWLPETEPKAGPALVSKPTRGLLRLGSDQELQRITTQLISANGSISGSDKDDLEWLIQRYRNQLPEVFPVIIPNRENLAFTASRILLFTDVPPDVIAPFLDRPTDVLRLAASLSEGDVSLSDNTRFRSFKRRERRFLLGLLERCDDPLEDMQRRPEAFKRLGERLHPGEYAHKFPVTASAFGALRTGLRVETFGARVERMLRLGDRAGASALLETRPGELARRLDHLLRDNPVPATVLDPWAARASRVSTPVLLQVMAHFRARSSPQEWRTFVPKGLVGKMHRVRDTREPLSAAVCDAVVATCRAALRDRFAELPSLGTVFVDPRMADFPVPFAQRSASKSLRTLPRGARLGLPEGRTLRFFLWWKEGAVGTKATGRVDIDLSAVFYSSSWEYKGHISYTQLRIAHLEACHSGDITSAPHGACEFIDVDLASAMARDVRYVVPSVYSFSTQPFCDLPECFAGWMMRKEAGSGAVFEPSTVQDKVDLAADTRISVPAVFDLQERCLVWADLALTSRPAHHVNLEENSRGLVHLAQSVTTLIKPTLADLFGLHAEARGTLVDDPDEAETVFSVERGTTPFDIATILSDFLQD